MFGRSKSRSLSFNARRLAVEHVENRFLMAADFGAEMHLDNIDAVHEPGSPLDRPLEVRAGGGIEDGGTDASIMRIVLDEPAAKSFRIEHDADPFSAPSDPRATNITMIAPSPDWFSG